MTRPHYLLDHRAGWRAARLGPGLGLDASGHLALCPRGALCPRPVPERPLVDADGGFGVEAVDAAGRIYRLDGTTILRSDPCTAELETLSCLGGEGDEPRRFRDPRGLAITPAGDLLVADSGNRRIQVFAVKGLVLRDVWGPPGAPDDTWLPVDVAVAPDGRTIWVSDLDSGLVHRLDCRGAWLGTFDPAEEGEPLRPEPEPPTTFETLGRFVSEALDGGRYRCVWHRVVLEARIEPGTRVTVETFTSESPKSAAEIELLDDERWSLGAVHTLTELDEWDCLVRSAPGRHLWLRLTVEGDGGATARIAAARVEFPRRSSLRHLPALYQEDPESRDFLDRFLAIFDTRREAIGGVIDDMARLFDPMATPAGEPEGDFLTWLASWWGLTLHRQLPLERRRRLLAEAHRLFALRGTLEGLKLHLRLVTGFEPRVLEHFRARRWLYVGGCGTDVHLGDCTELFGADLVKRLRLDEHSRIGGFPRRGTMGGFQLIDSGDPVSDPFGHLAHRFTVYLPRTAVNCEAARRLVEHVVELAKPAHTEAEIELVEPRLRIGVQARVGVDTVVGLYPEGVVLGGDELGRGTVLGPSEDEAAAPTLRLGVRSRIGSSTLID